MSFFGWLKSDNVMNKNDGHLRKFGEWIGNQKFTREDMAELDAETAAGIRQFAIDTLSESTDRSIARREMALFIIRFYTLLLFIAGMTYKIDKEWAEFWLKLAVETQIGWLVCGVGAFFWGTHSLRSYLKGKKKS